MAYPGPVLGFSTNPNGSRLFWHYPGDKPLFTVAPNRSGKSISVIYPNLILHPGSIVLSDPKNEHSSNFARWRAERLGQECLVFDPFHDVADADLPRVDGVPSRATFNPLDLVRVSRHPVATAKMLATAALPRGKDDKPFFVRSSRNELSAWLVFVACDPMWPRARNLGEVWNLLNREGDELKELLMTMSVSTVCRGFCARAAKRRLAGNNDTMRDVVSTIHASLGSILDDPEMIDNLASSSPVFGFDPLLDLIERADQAALAWSENPDDPDALSDAEEMLMAAHWARQQSDQAGFARLQHKPCSVFLVLPGQYTESHALWMRLMLACVFAGIEAAGQRPRDPNRPRTLVMIDEGFSLGPMESLLASFSRMPAYDVTFWPFFQDFTQVRELYGHDMWETFIENAGVLQAFGHPRGFTAEYLSKLTGRVTVATRSTTDNTNPTTGIGTTRGETGRPARFPDEIARIDLFPEGPPKQLLFYAGKPFRITDRLRHFIDFPEYMRFIARQQSGQVRLIAE